GLRTFPDFRYSSSGPYGFRGAYVALGKPRAVCEIRLPAPDAEVFIDGAKLDSSGSLRRFEAPLAAARMCEIEARWVTPKSIGSARRTVVLRPGEVATADLTSRGG